MLFGAAMGAVSARLYRLMSTTKVPSSSSTLQRGRSASGTAFFPAANDCPLLGMLSFIAGRDPQCEARVSTASLTEQQASTSPQRRTSSTWHKAAEGHWVGTISKAPPSGQVWGSQPWAQSEVKGVEQDLQRCSPSAD